MKYLSQESAMFLFLLLACGTYTLRKVLVAFAALARSLNGMRFWLALGLVCNVCWVLGGVALLSVVLNVIRFVKD